MRFVFLMDPVETVLADADTSFAIMMEAHGRGHRVDHCLLADLWLEHGALCARVRQATMSGNTAVPITLGSPGDVALDSVDAVFVRKDPPFNSAYLWATLLLERVRHQTFVVNEPRGLRDANEKLYACHFPELMPETLVCADKARILGFVARVGGRAVIKPLDGAGGEGVMMLARGDTNMNAIIEAATRHGTRMAMAQRYLPEVRRGDKRILLLDGEPLGAILRVPRDDEHRSNIHVGATVEAAHVNDADARIIATLAPRLRADGLWFAGIDVIAGALTEVNVTSPTGIQQMSRLGGENLAGRVVDWLECRADIVKRSVRH